MSVRQALITNAKAAIDAVHRDTSVSPEQSRDDLSDLSNHIDDLMRAIDLSWTPDDLKTGDYADQRL